MNDRSAVTSRGGTARDTSRAGRSRTSTSSAPLTTLSATVRRATVRPNVRRAVRLILASLVAVTCGLCPLPAQGALHWNNDNGPFGGTVLVVNHDGWGRLYAGTDGFGVYRSDNGGQSWYHLGFKGCKIYDVEVNPANPSVIAVACEMAQRGLFISRDGGESWEPCPLNETIAPCIQVAFNPQEPERMYAGFMDDQLYYSTDGGYEWTAFPFSFSKYVDPFWVDYAPSRIYVDPEDPDRILVGTGLELHYLQPGGGFYISEDGGWHFEEVFVQGADAINFCLDFSPADAQTILASFDGSGLCRSTDGGWNWAQLSDILPMDLHFDPGDFTQVWACAGST